MNFKEIVRKGYDAASYHYRSDADIDPDDPQLEATSRYHQWLDRLESELESGARILELGCGCGLPVARRFADQYEYTGVDLSLVQCKRAHRLVPQARIVCSDMTTLDFPPSNFDAILAFFSIIHVPLEEQQTLFQQITRWLQPDGLFMVTIPLNTWTGTEEDWYGSGAAMYWSHADTSTYLQWLADLQFKKIWSHFMPEGEDGFNLILAKKTTAF
jgi:cyclopropane fatty-acyl-phospholipid synthase-like methyltransferase